jgi:hypothetical protein
LSEQHLRYVRDQDAHAHQHPSTTKNLAKAGKKTPTRRKTTIVRCRTMFHVKHNKNIRPPTAPHRSIRNSMAMANRMANASEWREVLRGCMRRFGRWTALLVSDDP